AAHERSVRDPPSKLGRASGASMVPALMLRIEGGAVRKEPSVPITSTRRGKMRHTCVVFSLLIAALVLARPADGQVKFGVQGAIITSVDEAQDLDFNGTTGLGARVALQPPMLPIGAVAQGVYYFPEGDLDYLTYSLAAQLRLPLPVVSPYAIG